MVICSNKCQDLERVTQILSHELVHMFDDCTAKVDWTNLYHLACSEVRKILLFRYANISCTDDHM